MPKPKLTKTQLEDLSRMKASTFYGSGGYAYVEIDNRGWKPYTTRPVQALLDKGIITIPRGENRRFYGRLESMEAYIVYLNPVAWEYPFKYDSDKSLSQVGDKIVQNAKIKQQEDARRLKERQDYDNLTEAEVYRQLFGAETICESCEVNQATHRYNPIGTSLLCLDCLEDAEEEDGGNMIPKDEESLYAEEFGAESRRENWFNTNYENFGQSKRRVRRTPSDYNMKCVDCGRRMACVGPYTRNDERSSPSNDFYAVWCERCRETPFSAEEFGADFYNPQNTMWKVFVEESSTIGQTDNPIIRINICRKCGATDNFHNPHIPPQYQHSVDADNCSRCDDSDAEIRAEKNYCYGCGLPSMGSQPPLEEIDVYGIRGERKKAYSCRNCYEDLVYRAEEGKVRTMSGKPHTPRKMVKDKDITPEEASKRLNLEANQKTYYREGKEAAKAVFMPELDERDSYGQLDTEYMVYFDLTPEEMVRDIEMQNPRYNQFAWGWSQGWDDATFEHLLNQDDNASTIENYNYSAENDTFEGEYIGTGWKEEYVPDMDDIKHSVILIGVGLLGLFGFKAFQDRKAAETFHAPQSCADDEEACDDGFVCIDGECIKTCKGDGDCASWQECRDDLHHTENVCGEDKTYSVSNPFAQKKQTNNQVDDTPSASIKPVGMTMTRKVVIGGSVIGVAAIGLAAMQNRNKNGGEE
jgi:hypothetical protein